MDGDSNSTLFRATPPVHPGDLIAVISPSGPSETEAIAAGVAWLSQRYCVLDDPRRVARHGYFAGPDSDRAAALLDAVCNPAVRAIFAARGGYGAMRVLEFAGDALYLALTRDPKPLVGFSDVTALHALWARAGVRSIHGPMVAAIGRGTVAERDRDELLAVLEGGTPAPWRGLSVWNKGEACGCVRGGNLSLLAALHGTRYALSLEGAVLFLEDTGERPYRIDRMLTTLRLSGALRRVSGVVVGEFTDCGPGPDGVNVTDVLRDRLLDLGVPVLAEAGFGHGSAQRVLPFGEQVWLRTDGSVEFVREQPREVASSPPI